MLSWTALISSSSSLFVHFSKLTNWLTDGVGLERGTEGGWSETGTDGSSEGSGDGDSSEEAGDGGWTEGATEEVWSRGRAAEASGDRPDKRKRTI